MPNACYACRLRKVKCVPLGDRCAFCTSIDIPCTTSPRQRQRAKGGRKAAAGGGASGTVTPPYGTGTTSPPHPHRGSSSSSESSSSFTMVPTAPPRSNAEPHNFSTIFTQPSPSSRLLGVPGLSRAALDSCIQTFFATLGEVFRLSQPESQFLRRVQVHLCCDSGLDIPPELADVANDPASQLLILAVACRGAPFSPYSFLSDALNGQCNAVLNEPDSLTSSPLDAIEAILLLSEQFVRPRHADAGQTSSPTLLDPLGKGTVVDLMFYHRLHIPPPPGVPDAERRLVLFWTVFVHDAIRSASAHTCHRIADEDIGWPMGPASDNMPYMALALITRQICARLLSPQAKANPLTDKPIRDALSTLDEFKAKMKVSLATLTAACQAKTTPDASVPVHASRPLRPVEQLFLLSMRNWLYLVILVAVQNQVERHPGQISPSVIASVEAAAMAACEDMSQLAQLSTAHQLHIHAPKSIRNHMAAFILFLIRTFTAIETPTVQQSSHYFALAETLNRGVRTASLFEDSAPLADTLRMALYHASSIDIQDAARVGERGLDGLHDLHTATHPVMSGAMSGRTSKASSPIAYSTLPDQQRPAADTSRPSTSTSRPSTAPSYGPPQFSPELSITPITRPKAASVPPVDMPHSLSSTTQAHHAVTISPTAFSPPRPSSSSSPGSTPSLPSPQYWPPTAVGAVGAVGPYPSPDTRLSAKVPLDWSTLMSTLEECGFELAIGPVF
ncbi:uncharacterized protein LOC62_06G008802 [Vanrija pseudolonga]|uniref:Zn(2)-C6 fungal-type domain-containing protein n=1 Tax=Vanrija pseudolonga TaxID=143232 RepID=A0AAF1BL08_9TREE|nr:hypothetical protein LOC62_06G008802 [Vanrija pseudolonga]